MTPFHMERHPVSRGQLLEAGLHHGAETPSPRTDPMTTLEGLSSACVRLLPMVHLPAAHSGPLLLLCCMHTPVMMA